MMQASAATDAPRLTFGDDEEEPVVVDPRFAEALRAAQRADKCFDIARRSSYPGERDAAISRGLAIIKKYGLRRALFDIPGQDSRDLEDALNAAAGTRNWWASTLRASEDETIYDAKRRAFDRAASDAAERDQASGRRKGPVLDRDAIRRADLLDRWPLLDTAIAALRIRRVTVLPIDLPPTMTWTVPGRSPDTFDEWQLRELADEVCG